MSINNQAPVKMYNLPDNYLAVHSIFRTIQGEGVFVGVPAIFVRLYGCNLQCPACDTDYTSVRKNLSVTEVVDEVDSLSGEVKTVVITGGEPFNQPLGLLIDELYTLGYTVQIETNGTLYQEDIDYDKCIVVCSPKTHRVHNELQKYIHSYKYVCSAGTLNCDGLPDKVLGLVSRKKVFRPAKDSIIYLQPLDEKCEERNQENLDAVLNSCIDNNYILCLQTHKITGVE